MANVTNPRKNNFNVLRLLAASAVIFSHSADITRGEHDKLEQWIGYSGGWIAVTAFFAISGMLIYRSIARSRSVTDYIIARCLRIFPGLWVMLVVTILVLGLFFTTASIATWFHDPQVYRYAVGNAVLYFPRYDLPGVFESHPTSGVVNGSLWTLRFEFTCYIAVLFLFLARGYKSERNFRILIVIYFLGYLGFLALAASRGLLDSALFDGSDISKLHRLSLAFFLGMLMGRYVDRFRPTWWMVVGSAVISWQLFGTVAFLTALTVSIVFLVFWLAFLQAPGLEAMRNMPDYSYGIYIYAFPVQQCVEHTGPSLNAFENGLASLAITVPIAAMSWHLIESPSLKFKSKVLAKKQVLPT